MVIVYADAMTYYIPEGNIGQFEKRIAKLIKRATKLGSRLEYVIKQDDFRDVLVKFVNNGKAVEKWVRHLRVDVDGDRPKYAGWNFIGTIEHTDEGNVMRMVPNETAPNQYRDVAPVCEHCKLKRMRKDTFLLRHETGTVTQVGSGCLVDFLGHENPQFLAQLASVWVNLEELADLAENAHWGGGGGGPTREREDLMKFLSIVAQIVILDNQFWSRSAVKRIEEKRGDHNLPEPTAWLAARCMNPSNCSKDIEDSAKYAPTDAAVKMAEDARDWVLFRYGTNTLPEGGSAEDIKEALLTPLANDQLNDFEHNLLVVAKGESCERRTFGIAAYIIEAYRKAHNMIPERKKTVRPESKHVGTVGERFKNLEVTCDHVHTWNSEAFGEGSLFKLITAEGNVLVWRTYYVSDANNMEKGKVYTVNATVKKHGEYNKEIQTELSRLKVVSCKGAVPQPENLEPNDTFKPTVALQAVAA
jgi:hypothetical protein